VNLKLQVIELAELVRRQLAGQDDAHLVAGRIAVGEVQHHHRARVVNAGGGDAVDVVVGHVAGLQVQVRAVLLGDRFEHRARAGLLGHQDQVIRLAGVQAADIRTRGEVRGQLELGVDVNGLPPA